MDQNYTPSLYLTYGWCYILVNLLTVSQYTNSRVLLVYCGMQELLELGEKIGYVNTGLKEDEISRCIRKIKLSLLGDMSLQLSAQVDRKCIVCQVNSSICHFVHNLFGFAFYHSSITNRRNMDTMMKWASWSVDMDFT